MKKQTLGYVDITHTHTHTRLATLQFLYMLIELNDTSLGNYIVPSCTKMYCAGSAAFETCRNVTYLQNVNAYQPR